MGKSTIQWLRIGMQSDDVTKKLEDYTKRMESTDNWTEIIQIFEEMGVYFSGIVDSEKDFTRKQIGTLFGQIMKLTVIFLKVFSDIYHKQSLLENRLEQIEIELDIKSKHK